MDNALQAWEVSDAERGPRVAPDLRLEQPFARLLGHSQSIEKIRAWAQRLARAEVDLLILGECGTGKNLLAQALHDASRRASGPLIEVNCAAFPDALLESELFGHVRGAFTGAERDRKGRFELAHRGTLFLNEVGEMSPSGQAKILRAVEEKEFEPVGGEKTIHSDVRIVAATNKDLPAAVKAGRFREDLYYRLAVVPIAMPALRDRREDIPILVGHFLPDACTKNGVPIRRLTPAAMAILESYGWPGNVRELRNVLQRAAVLSDDEEIGTGAFAHLARDAVPTGSPGVQHVEMGCAPRADDMGDAIDALWRTRIGAAMTGAGRVKSRAANLLGITRQKLDYQMKRLGIDQ